MPVTSDCDNGIIDAPITPCITRAPNSIGKVNATPSPLRHRSVPCQLKTPVGVCITGYCALALNHRPVAVTAEVERELVVKVLSEKLDNAVMQA